MHKTVLRLLGLCLACWLTSLPAWAQNAASTIRVTEPFARAAQAGHAAAAYMNIQGGPDRLIGAVSDVAAQVELHETVMADGALTMRPVGGILINPGIASRLVPGGLHVMLSNLKRTLKDGDIITMILTFERAGKVTVPVPIASSGVAARPSVAVPGLRGTGR